MGTRAAIYEYDDGVVTGHLWHATEWDGENTISGKQVAELPVPHEVKRALGQYNAPNETLLRHKEEQLAIMEYERWDKHQCPTCGRIHAPEVF